MFELDPVPNSIASFTNGFPYCICVLRFFFFLSCKYRESFPIRLVFFHVIFHIFFEFVFTLHCFFHYVSCNVFFLLCSVVMCGALYMHRHTCKSMHVHVFVFFNACAQLRAHNLFFSIDVYSKMSERDAFMEMVFVRWHLKIFTFTQTTTTAETCVCLSDFFSLLCGWTEKDKTVSFLSPS